MRTLPLLFLLGLPCAAATVPVASPAKAAIHRWVTVPSRLQANQQTILHAKVGGYLQSIAVRWHDHRAPRRSRGLHPRRRDHQRGSHGDGLRSIRAAGQGAGTGGGIHQVRHARPRPALGHLAADRSQGLAPRPQSRFEQRQPHRRGGPAERGRQSVRQNLPAEVGAGFFDLLRAQAALEVGEESKTLAADYETQVTAAVAAGVAFEADQYRAQAQALRHELATHKALEYVAPSAVLGGQVRRALDKCPELRSREALLEAARADTEATTKASLIPDLSLRATTGGLGGGKNGNSGSFDDSSEFMLGVVWRIGPGGLFDHARTASACAAEASEDILLEKARPRITCEVLEAMARVRSVEARLVIVRKLLEATEKSYQLSLDRSSTGVGGVLETLRSEEDLSFARLAWFELVTEYHKAQLALRRACGG